jgi:hypothetical protein
MIINKDFAGLVDLGNYYKYDGDIVTTGILDIRVPLFVMGSINASEWIKASEWIEASESIKAGEWIDAGEWINAGKWIEAGVSIKAGGSINASEWIKAGWSINAGGRINASWSINAGGRINASGWIKAGVSIKAGGRINASGWIKAGKWIKMYCIRTKTLKIITGMVHVIWILDTHIKIGCEMRTKEAWTQITEEQAKEMGDDGSIWAIRDALLLM